MPLSDPDMSGVPIEGMSDAELRAEYIRLVREADEWDMKVRLGRSYWMTSKYADIINQKAAIADEIARRMQGSEVQ